MPPPPPPVQVALEGEISEESIRHSLRRGIRQAGDLIPWTISQQFQDDDFGKLSGARVVRIATHPGTTMANGQACRCKVHEASVLRSSLPLPLRPLFQITKARATAAVRWSS